MVVEKPWGIVVKKLKSPKNGALFSVHVTRSPGKREFFTHGKLHKQIIKVREKVIARERRIGTIDLVVDHGEKLFTSFHFFPMFGDVKSVLDELGKQGVALFARKQMVKHLISLYPDYHIKSAAFDRRMALYLFGIGINPYKTYPLKKYLSLIEAHEEKLRGKRA